MNRLFLMFVESDYVSYRFIQWYSTIYTLVGIQPFTIVKVFGSGMEAKVKQSGWLCVEERQYARRIRNCVCEFVDTVTILFSCHRIGSENPTIFTCCYHQSLTHTLLHDTNTYPTNYHNTDRSLIVNHAADLDQKVNVAVNQTRFYSTATIIAPGNADLSESQRACSDHWFKLFVAALLRIKKRFDRMFGNARNQYFSKSSTLIEVSSTLAGDKEHGRRKTCHS